MQNQSQRQIVVLGRKSGVEAPRREVRNGPIATRQTEDKKQKMRHRKDSQLPRYRPGGICKNSSTEKERETHRVMNMMKKRFSVVVVLLYCPTFSEGSSVSLWIDFELASLFVQTRLRIIENLIVSFNGSLSWDGDKKELCRSELKKSVDANRFSCVRRSYPRRRLDERSTKG